MSIYCFDIDISFKRVLSYLLLLFILFIFYFYVVVIIGSVHPGGRNESSKSNKAGVASLCVITGNETFAKEH